MNETACARCSCRRQKRRRIIMSQLPPDKARQKNPRTAPQTGRPGAGMVSGGPRLSTAVGDHSRRDQDAGGLCGVAARRAAAMVAGGRGARSRGRRSPPGPKRRRSPWQSAAPASSLRGRFRRRLLTLASRAFLRNNCEPALQKIARSCDLTLDSSIAPVPFPLPPGTTPGAVLASQD